MTLGDTVVSAWLQPSCLRCLQVDVSQFVERVVLSLGLKFQTHEKFHPPAEVYPLVAPGVLYGLGWCP